MRSEVHRPVPIAPTDKPRISFHTMAVWGDVAHYVITELMKPESEAVSVTRSDLEAIVTLLRGLTSISFDFDAVPSVFDFNEGVPIVGAQPEGFDDIAYRAEQRHWASVQLHNAVRDSTEPEAKELIEELRQHIKELKREARERARWA